MEKTPIVRLTDSGTELFCYKGMEIETDRKDNKIYDSVLPIYPGSGVHYLIDHLIVRKEDIALDLCTGSGVLGIYASKKASKVVATDISKRALAFARRNAKRNNILNLEFREGDLFKPVRGERFDYIISNPPFVPIPKNLRAALHSNGGTDGLYFVRKILGRAEEFLKPKGRMQLYSLTFGTKEKTLLEDILRDTLKNRKIKRISFYSEPLPLEDFLASFEKYSVDTWRKELEKRGVTHLHSYIVNIEPGKRLEISKELIPRSKRKTFPDHWDNWKKKFSFWVLNN